MAMIFILAGDWLAKLPMILVGVLVVGLFLAGLYFIIERFFPVALRPYATGVVIVVAIILLIIFLLSLVGIGPALGAP